MKREDDSQRRTASFTTGIFATGRTGVTALIGVVEYGSVFAGTAVEARHASAAEARPRERAVYVAKAGEVK